MAQGPSKHPNRLSIEDYIEAAESLGYRCKKGAKRSNIISSVCHIGGDNPNGVWVTERNGYARAFCHKCPSNESDKNVRRQLNLPEWQEPQLPTSNKDKQYSDIERWTYHNPTTGENLTAIIERYKMRCWRNDLDLSDEKYCNELYAHKHPVIQRGGERFEGTPTDGCSLYLHDAAQDPEDNNGNPLQINNPNNHLVIAEGQKTAVAITEIGYQAASYPQGSNYAPKADYRDTKGRNVLIAPDNDTSGEIAAYESAIGCLKADASTVEILDVVGRKNSGADLADVDKNKRYEIIQKGGTVTYIATPQNIFHLETTVAILKFNVKCRYQYRTGIPLIDASNQHNLNDHVTEAWNAVLDYHVDRREVPNVYEWSQGLAFVERTSEGMIIKHHNETTAKKMSSQAIEWHRGFKETLVATGSANGPLPRDKELEILDTLVKYDAKAHGYMKYIEKTTDKRGNELPCLLYTSPSPRDS